MSRHVISAMSRKRIFGDVMPSRNVAIWGASSQLGLDIMTHGVPADAAGLRHDHRSSFLAPSMAFGAVGAHLRHAGTTATGRNLPDAVAQTRSSHRRAEPDD